MIFFKISMLSDFSTQVFSCKTMTVLSSDRDGKKNSMTPFPFSCLYLWGFLVFNSQSILSITETD